MDKILKNYFSLPQSEQLNAHLLRCYGASGAELVDAAFAATAAAATPAPRQNPVFLQTPAVAGAQKSSAYPAAREVFRAFALTPCARVLILGQDPYHDGCACGLAFASRNKTAPSLRTIARELALERDFGAQIAVRADAAQLAKAVENPPKLGEGALQNWAQQGVLLLNAALSVAPGAAGSHTAIWADFTRFVLGQIRPQVALLWGAAAQKYAPLLWPDCAVLAAAHPSPLARGKFYGCGHFLLANEILRARGEEEIRWI